MKCEGARTSSDHRRWQRYSVSKKVLLVALLACLLALMVRYEAYIRWKIVSARSGWSGVRAIPTHRMPDTSMEEKWPRCRFGSLEFILPPEFVNSGEVKTNGSVIILAFCTDLRSMIVTVPTKAQDRRRIFAELQKDYALPCERQRLSLTKLRLASYRASSDDFRWSMTQQELRWHMWCICMRSAFTLGSGQSAEYVLRDDMEGILNLSHGARIVNFDWQTADDSFGGSFVFSQKNGQIDPTWVRCVCQSVRFTVSGIPRPIPQEEQGLRAMLEITERVNVSDTD